MKFGSSTRFFNRADGYFRQIHDDTENKKPIRATTSHGSNEEGMFAFSSSLASEGGSNMVVKPKEPTRKRGRKPSNS
ncbi:hypothetical protein KSP40_PGU021652 [Platanthera guangdongensis]|uniref:Uncharacterized protein n=1 Tax=Platanthera guangdongensis TaxID=2320717 RepID=A0ABR2LSD8_9ASPA